MTLDPPRVEDVRLVDARLAGATPFFDDSMKALGSVPHVLTQRWVRSSLDGAARRLPTSATDGDAKYIFHLECRVTLRSPVWVS
jgi:hypothetical protein